MSFEYISSSGGGNFLATVLSKSATQGLGPADYVFKNLVKYYEKVKEDG